MSPRQQYRLMVQYTQLKVDQKDWHGVSDAANDLRELVAANPNVEKPLECTCGSQLKNGPRIALHAGDCELVTQ